MAVLIFLNITIFCQACVYSSNRRMARNMLIALEAYNSKTTLLIDSKLEIIACKYLSAYYIDEFNMHLMNKKNLVCIPV